jgi:PTH1 family peptidyl-tRNA hydrolase
LVIGMGNPGPRYAETRHNVGFTVVEIFARRRGWSFKAHADELLGAAGKFAGAEIRLIKPLTWMNLTGKIVPFLQGDLEDPATDLMVVLDDLDLPLGRLRVRTRGRSGGHRGLESVIQARGATVFPRLRVGVGRPPPSVDAKDHVLTRFGPEEREAAAEALERAADALECWTRNGIDMTMNLFNRDPAP